ncbi:MAG: hypothetical protein IT166_04710 [Bryobacterales bacterium]|nr:hypothetical protein [Bryobacterales bacterium]
MNRAAIHTLAAAFAAVSLCGQQQQSPSIYQTVNCIKVTPGKGPEYLQLARDATLKFMQARADSGEITSWVLLRSVIPAGAEARCDFATLTTHSGSPALPMNRESAAAVFRKAGLGISTDEYVAKRNGLSRLVSTEIWRRALLTGHPEKGNYLYTNNMKVHNMKEYAKFERDVWLPMAEEWIKEGGMTGWGVSVAVLPGGADVKYAARSADIFPNWEAAFKPRNLQAMFAKVHAGKDFEETMSGLSKLRDLARRELWVIEESVMPAR